MVFSGLRHSWLLALADPTGPRDDLPAKPLRPWDMAPLCELAGRHGVLPTFLANLRQTISRHGAASVIRPSANHSEKPALAAAEDAVIRQTALTMLLRRQAAEIVAALARAGVPALILKGSEFADRLYPRPGARLFSDVDLLVPQTSGAAAALILRDLSYEPTANSMKYEEGYGEQGWRRKEPAGGLVEIHWNLVNSPTLRRVVSVTYEDLQIESAAERGDDRVPRAACPPVPAAEQLTPAPAPPGQRLTPASLLLVAAVHGATSHGFDQLRMLYDVAQIVRGAAGSVDEAWLSGAAAGTGAVLSLETALRLTGEVLPEPQCDAFLERLQLPAATWLSKATLTRGAVLRGHAAVDGLRRQAFREFLKRP
jgi:hypothetical protein